MIGWHIPEFTEIIQLDIKSTSNSILSLLNLAPMAVVAKDGVAEDEMKWKVIKLW